MATNTPNLNLVKPEMSDYADIRVLNGNMDILDKEVGGLNYVKDVTKSDEGLTFTKKDDTKVSVPLDYMKITGGNFTGDITVKEKPVISIMETITSDKQTSIKYSDGTLKQYGTIDSPERKNVYLNCNFQIPFIDANYYVLTASRGDLYDTGATTPNVSHDTLPYIHDVNKTPTSCLIQCDDYATGIYWEAVGRWK